MLIRLRLKRRTIANGLDQRQITVVAAFRSHSRAFSGTRRFVEICIAEPGTSVGTAGATMSTSDFWLLVRTQFTRSKAALVAATFGLAVSTPNAAVADEGGVSFWVPGIMGSLAATPQVPGWAIASIYYHTSVKAGGDIAFARQVSRGQITANWPDL